MADATPGPWRLTGEYETLIRNAEGRIIAQIYVPDPGHPPLDWEQQLRVTGHLMAAAPELLDACRVAIQVARDTADQGEDCRCDFCRIALPDLLRAVAKAMGEGED